MKRIILCLVAIAGMVLPSFAALARDEIRIVGSSTVFPFSTAVAEQFGKKTSFKTPVVEATGSGGGLKLFCAGSGRNTPDITNSSRRIKAGEVERCAKNGVNDIVEIKVGFDGIVMANAKSAEVMFLTKKQIFLALAKVVPVDGKMIENPHKTWKDVDSALPATEIEVLGPPPTSGTRDAFVELAMEGGARKLPMLKALKKSDKKKFKAIAHAIREDGAFGEAGENDNLIVQKREANPDALGIFGFSFLDQNSDKVQGSFVDGSEPTFDNIASGKYGVSRSLYFYVKKSHVGKVPGIKEFLAEFTSEGAAGAEGYLSDRGLIPLSEKDRVKIRNDGSTLALLRM